MVVVTAISLLFIYLFILKQIALECFLLMVCKQQHTEAQKWIENVHMIGSGPEDH